MPERQLSKLGVSRTLGRSVCIAPTIANMIDFSYQLLNRNDQIENGGWLCLCL